MTNLTSMFELGITGHGKRLRPEDGQPEPGTQRQVTFACGCIAYRHFGRQWVAPCDDHNPRTGASSIDSVPFAWTRRTEAPETVAARIAMDMLVDCLPGRTPEEAAAEAARQLGIPLATFRRRIRRAAKLTAEE